jgi:hypothetical protein
MDKKFMNLGIGIATMLISYALLSCTNIGKDHYHPSIGDWVIMAIGCPLGLLGFALFIENLYKIYESLR